MKRWLPLLLFAGLALLLFVGVQRSGDDNREAIASPLIGKPAPAFSLPDFRRPGEVIDNQALAGKPYLLNVWASWCPSCRLEHPVISDLAKRGVVQVVGYNYKDDPDDAARWLRQFGDPYHVILADRSGRRAIDWGIYGAPETFLVDARGIVVFKQVGPVTYDVVEQEILPRLKETPP
ncbi:MAG: DsbE family thiol:disulfide interchange protein [Xanthomonadales bacterium]|nr:DsbE family thiol:disulfide interchange protein [Xanthomonadales bacterium]